MKSLIVLVGIAVVLLACSTASAGWYYGAPVVVARPPAVVHSFYPVGPVYGYPAPVVTVAPRVVYRTPVVYPAPVAYPAPAVVYRTPVVYPAPVVIYPKVFVRGQPVRNVIRAVLP